MYDLGVVTGYGRSLSRVSGTLLPSLVLRNRDRNTEPLLLSIVWLRVLLCVLFADRLLVSGFVHECVRLFVCLG